MRSVVGMVNDISEPFVALSLSSEVGPWGLGVQSRMKPNVCLGFGELKTRSMEFKKEKVVDEILDLVTVVSSNTTAGTVRGAVRPDRKVGKSSKPLVIF